MASTSTPPTSRRTNSGSSIATPARARCSSAAWRLPGPDPSRSRRMARPCSSATRPRGLRPGSGRRPHRRLRRGVRRLPARVSRSGSGRRPPVRRPVPPARVRVRERAWSGGPGRALPPAAGARRCPARWRPARMTGLRRCGRSKRWLPRAGSRRRIESPRRADLSRAEGRGQRHERRQLVAISPDGRHLYARGARGIPVFDRLPNGDLRFASVFSPPPADNGYVPTRVSINKGAKYTKSRRVRVRFDKPPPVRPGTREQRRWIRQREGHSGR